MPECTILRNFLTKIEKRDTVQALGCFESDAGRAASTSAIADLLGRESLNRKTVRNPGELPRTKSEPETNYREPPRRIVTREVAQPGVLLVTRLLVTRLLRPG